ncbi:MAG: hypothetical protein FJW34_06025 [Acidobacteria bacterium]|nr:hypothetical protein [Acidobacteriota bacterium]
MAYVLSSANRLYVALEQNYGVVPAVAAEHRIPAVKLMAQQRLERPERRDKTGSRTFPGIPWGLRKRTNWELRTYLTAWSEQTQPPSYGALVQAGLGGAPEIFQGSTVGEGSSGKVLNLAGAHGLAVGQAVTFGGEIRFVVSIVSGTSVELNAPFTLAPTAGSPVGKTVSYGPQTELGSASLYDYWTPGTAVQRILNGAGVNRIRVTVNGDYHELEFSGPARDIIDNASFAAGQGEMQSFPEEPAAELFDYSIVPGHLGEAWLGNTPDLFYTVTEAELVVDNDLETRSREFGCKVVPPYVIAPGRRKVTLDLTLYEQDDAATKALYQAARQQSPVAVMFQLGQQAGQLFGVYLKSVVPEVPEFDDSDRRLEWRFRQCQAQGTVDDEIYVAFG